MDQNSVNRPCRLCMENVELARKPSTVHSGHSQNPEEVAFPLKRNKARLGRSKYPNAPSWEEDNLVRDVHSGTKRKQSRAKVRTVLLEEAFAESYYKALYWGSDSGVEAMLESLQDGEDKAAGNADADAEQVLNVTKGEEQKIQRLWVSDYWVNKGFTWKLTAATWLALLVVLCLAALLLRTPYRRVVTQVTTCTRDFPKPLSGHCTMFGCWLVDRNVYESNYTWGDFRYETVNEWEPGALRLSDVLEPVSQEPLVNSFVYLVNFIGHLKQRLVHWFISTFRSSAGTSVNRVRSATCRVTGQQCPSGWKNIGKVENESWTPDERLVCLYWMVALVVAFMFVCHRRHWVPRFGHKVEAYCLKYRGTESDDRPISNSLLDVKEKSRTGWVTVTAGFVPFKFFRNLTMDGVLRDMEVQRRVDNVEKQAICLTTVNNLLGSPRSNDIRLTDEELLDKFTSVIANTHTTAFDKKKVFLGERMMHTVSYAWNRELSERAHMRFFSEFHFGFMFSLDWWKHLIDEGNWKPEWREMRIGRCYQVLESSVKEVPIDESGLVDPPSFHGSTRSYTIADAKYVVQSISGSGNNCGYRVLNHWLGWDCKEVSDVRSRLVKLVAGSDQTDTTLAEKEQAIRRLSSGRALDALTLKVLAYSCGARISIWDENDAKGGRFIYTGDVAAPLSFYALQPKGRLHFDLMIPEDEYNSVVGGTKYIFGYNALDAPMPKMRALDSGSKIASVRENEGRKYVYALHDEHVRGAILPTPDRSESSTIAMGFQHRLGCVMPDVLSRNTKLQRKFLAFVKRFCKTHLLPLDPSTDVSVESWAKRTNYPEKRKQDLVELWHKLSGVFSREVDTRVKAFVKAESYDSTLASGLKYPRGIYSRTDDFKCLSGPFVKVIEEEVFKLPYFIKKVPKADRPDYIHGMLHCEGAWYFATDFTSFESHANPVAMTITEFVFYEYMLANVPGGPDFVRWFWETLTGKQKIRFKDVVASTTGRRMSGEMNTSLGNGLANLMYTLFCCEQAGCRDVLGVVEGDDGLFRVRGNPPNPKVFSDLGLVIKFSPEPEVLKASFCGVIAGEKRRRNCANPLTNMIDFGVLDMRYANASAKKKNMLLSCKAMSMLYEYNGCPVLETIGRKYSRLNAAGLRRFIRTSGAFSCWERDQLLEALNATHAGLIKLDAIDWETRELVEEKFGLLCADQKWLEETIKNEGLPGVTQARFGHLFDVQWQQFYDNFVDSDSSQGQRRSLIAS